MVRWSLFTDHAGLCTAWSLISFIIPSGNLLHLMSSVFLHSKLSMTHASQRKHTLFLELCSSVIVHLPTLPLPSHTPFATASLSILLFWCSTSTIRFVCWGGELLSLHFYLKIKSSDWCLQKDLFLLGSVYAMQWHAHFYFFFRKIYLKKRTLLFCRDISCVLYWYTLHVVLPGQDMLMPK